MDPVGLVVDQAVALLQEDNVRDNIRSFKAILSGDYDSYPESAFIYAGTIEDVEEKAGKNAV